MLEVTLVPCDHIVERAEHEEAIPRVGGLALDRRSVLRAIIPIVHKILFFLHMLAYHESIHRNRGASRPSSSLERTVLAQNHAGFPSRTPLICASCARYMQWPSSYGIRCNSAHSCSIIVPPAFIFEYGPVGIPAAPATRYRDVVGISWGADFEPARYRVPNGVGSSWPAPVCGRGSGGTPRAITNNFATHRANARVCIQP